MPGKGGEWAGGASDERGQSSVIGVILVVGITVMGVTGVLVFGSGALQSSQTQSEIDAAEHAMTQLDSRFSLAALGSAKHQGSTVKLRGGAAMHVDGDSGWMNVSVINQSNDEVELTVLNTSLGAIVYEHDDTTIAYQGGGVWKRSPNGGTVMVSPPEFHYREISGHDPTLTLPLVVIRGNGTLTGDARVTKELTGAGYPVDGDPDRTNPLTEGEVNVTVHSEYYEAWGAFFEDRTGGTVSYDHDRQLATITLKIEQTSSPVQGGIVSGAGGSTLTFSNHASTDSYNSSEGNYSATSGQNTSIIVAGDFDLGNWGTVEGSVIAGGEVTLGNHAQVTGDVEEDADVTPPRAVDWLIDDRREAINSTNDNGDSDVDISGNSLDDCATTCELDNGSYYLDELALQGGDHLLLDTTQGDIDVVVDGDADLGGDTGTTTVEVVGGNSTRFYVEGDGEIGGDGNVTAPDERSTGVWFYMNPDATFTFSNDARLVGIIYGPGSGAHDGVYIDLANHGTIYGGLVGDVPTVNNHLDLHFDEALLNEDPLSGHATGQPTVTYLHVSTNRVNVTSS